MLESERSLWLRAAVLLVPAPMVLALLVYVAAPWVDPGISERARTEVSLGIGFGTAMCFTATLLLGVMRGQWRDVPRADRIWFLSHALSLFSIGLGAVLLVGFGGTVASIGWILLVGGVIVRVAGLLVRWIARLA